MQSQLDRIKDTTTKTSTNNPTIQEPSKLYCQRMNTVMYTKQLNLQATVSTYNQSREC